MVWKYACSTAWRIVPFSRNLVSLVLCSSRYIVTNHRCYVMFIQGGGPGAAADSKGVVARTYLVRLKNEEETSKLASIIKDHTPSE